MGKKLVIKGADFAQNAIDLTFNPLNWFKETVDEQCQGIPTGYAVATEASITDATQQSTGMVSPQSGQGMLYYGKMEGSSFSDPRFSTRHAVSLKTLYDNGYTSLKLTAKVVGNIVVLYSDTPTVSSINPYSSGQMAYNTSTDQITIPITANTYIFFQAKRATGDTSDITSKSITYWLDISFV